MLYYKDVVRHFTDTELEFVECDICKLKVHDGEGRIRDMIRIEQCFNYFSEAFGNRAQVCIDLCPTCFKDKLGAFTTIVDKEDDDE